MVSMRYRDGLAGREWAKELFSAEQAEHRRTFGRTDSCLKILDCTCERKETDLEY
jgi:hypothetical protein